MDYDLLAVRDAMVAVVLVVAVVSSTLTSCK